MFEDLNASEVLKVDDVVTMWVERMQQMQQSYPSIGSPQVQYEIDWHKARIDHDKPVFNDIFNPPSPKQQVLFKTTYTNDTDAVQEYIFRAESTTDALAELLVYKGVCINQFPVVVPLPHDVADANAGFPSELSVCERMSGKWKEKMKWSVDNKIMVPPHESVTAKLLVGEKQWNGEFSINTKLSGKVRVVIRNGNGNVRNVVGDLREIFSNAKQSGLTAGNLSVLSNAVQFVTTGKMVFRYGVEQKVSVDSLRV